MPLRPMLCLLAAVTLDLATASGALAAWPNNPAINLQVCTAANTQSNPRVVADGNGGAIIVWQDNRTPASDYDIYAQHVLRTGIVDPSWPLNGRLLCGAAGAQTNPVAVSDGVGGVLVAWTDARVAGNDIYAGRVLANGTVDPAWATNGVAICTATGAQTSPTIIGDGATGALIAWTDARAGNTDIYAQHVSSAGVVDAGWPANGRGVVTEVDPQSAQAMCSDGAGGAILAWVDARGLPLTYIIGEHVLSTGALDPAWPAQGQFISNTNGGTLTPALAPDGQGGAVVTWAQFGASSGYDIRVQRLSGAGVVSWGTGGIFVVSALGDQVSPSILPDGLGGALVTWRDLGNANDMANYVHHVLFFGLLDQSWPAAGRRLGGNISDAQAASITTDGAGGLLATWSQNFGDIYAGHGQLSGAVDATYPVDGKGVSVAFQSQTTPAIDADGVGGAIIAWVDTRLGTSDIYCQRIARFAYLGTPEVEIASVRDVVGDQGGKVKLSWNGSYLDANSDPNLSTYEIYRSVAAAAAAAAIAGGARLSRVEDGHHGPGSLIQTRDQAGTYYWEFVLSQAPLHYVTTYSNVVATGGDSTSNSLANTAFMIVARNASSTIYWLSAPDSGHSVDNLPPGAPLAFTGQYQSGASALHWLPNQEADLAGYHLYRGTVPGFVAGPSNLVATLADTGYTDPAGSVFYYRISAFDIHGNEGPSSLALPGPTTDVPGGEPELRLALSPPTPNPAAGDVQLEFVTPQQMEVRLSIYDAAGRLVKSLWNGDAVGKHGVRWDRRNEEGRSVGGGVYWVHLVAGGRTLRRRIVAL